MNELDSRTIRRLSAIEAALTARALTASELAAETFMHPNSALEYIRNLGDRIHIEGWREIGPGRRVAMYRWGAGKNKPKPRAKSGVQNERNRLARIKQDPDAHARYLAIHRARYAVKKAKKAPQNWASALLGAAVREVRH